MDFDKSKINIENKPRDAYYTIRGILNLVISLENSDIALKCDTYKIDSLMSSNAPITNDTYTQIKILIDNMIILYEKSKLPPNPFLKKI